MFLRFLSCLLIAGTTAATSAQTTLRICADPDNLPFSNRAGQGFDLRIAELVARDMHRKPVFVWARSRRGFVRELFNKGACDMLPGVPAGMHGVAVTRPYYASSYVFVTRAAQHLQIASFADSRLKRRRIGLQILEEDLSPPSIPLIRYGYAPQLIGFDGFGVHEGDVVHAVAERRVGVAIVWGPVAGYYAQLAPAKLALTPVSPLRDSSGIPFAYRIGFAVHAKDTALLNQINGSIVRLSPQIHRILATYHVPLLPAEDLP